RDIFRTYCELGSLLAAASELNARGWTTKAWTTQDGAQRRGQPFTQTSLYALLVNPLYLGRIRAGDEIVVAQHEAIVEEELWSAVQAQLTGKARVQRGWRPPTKNGAMLRGLLSCSCGASMIHSSARRHGRRFRYYVCAKALKLGAKACPGSRAPLGE